MAEELSAVSAVPSQRSGDAHRFVPLAPQRSPASAADRTAPPEDEAALPAAIEQMRSAIAGGRTDLQFRVEKDLGRVVVSVIDAQDGKVLRQIPGEEVLRIARMLSARGGALIQAQA